VVKLPLSPRERDTLIEAHGAQHTKRFADRIKSILLLDEGKTYEEIARILLLDDSTIRRYETEYNDAGIDALIVDDYTGGTGNLSVTQIAELTKHVREQLFHRAKDIAAFVEKTYHISYTPEGMTRLLHRLGFSYKKTKQVPGKADPERQRTFLMLFRKIKKSLGKYDELYFTDASHPQHNSMPAYAWIPTGEEKEIKTNTGRDRVNLNGALSARDHSAVVLSADTVNAEAMIELFKALEAKHPKAQTIHLIADNAKYNHAIKVQEYVKTSRVKIHYLPPYAPNLNLIERLWKFFHKKTLYNHYYPTYLEFKTASLDFFENMHQYQDELDTLLTENFHIIGERVSQT
jgi:transposase